MVIFATPLLLVLADATFLPLILNVIVFFLRYLPLTLASFTCRVSLLADFLRATVLRLTTCFTVNFLVTDLPKAVA